MSLRAYGEITTHRKVEVDCLGVGFSEEMEVEDGELWKVIPEGGKERVGE